MKHNSSNRHTLFGIRPDFLVCLFLSLITLAVYWQVIDHEFVCYDDTLYVTRNNHIKNGLTLKNIFWSLTAEVSSNWHPLTLLSHMSDCQFYGLNSGLHHLTSLLFHMANTLLLFLVLRRMTMTSWNSAFVAALFAVHPLQVESVAWVAERKDVLSTFFWLLTMWAYALYAQRPGIKRYLTSLVFFALGLMAKPMLVTLPFVLLLLDYWPLKRFQFDQQDALRLVLEKIPFFLFTAASCILTFHFQQSGGAVVPLDRYPLSLRIANAIVSYTDYIIKMFWPFKLAAYYPHPEVIPMWQSIGACLLLLSITFFSIRAIKQHSWVTVGWLWYTGTLFPVIGLVQVGSQAMADRYTYVPLIGLFIIIAWGVPKVLERWRYKKTGLAIMGATAVLILTMMTTLQVRYWSDSVTLFEHALRVTTNNAVAHWSLGVVLGNQGKTAEAIRHYYKALQIDPMFPGVHNNLGNVLIRQGKTNEAIKHFSMALKLKPGDPEAYYNMGLALATQKKYNEALQYYQKTLRISPGHDKAYTAGGNVLWHQGKPDEAIYYYFKALQINPESDETHFSMGVVMADQGNIDKAILHYSEALRLNPVHESANFNMGIILADLGRYNEATRHFSEALHINPDNADTHNNMGSVLARQGRFSEAVKHFSKALSIDPDNTDAHFNMGYTMSLDNNTDKALFHYSEAVRTNPDHFEAHTGMGNILAAQGKTAEAIAHYTKALAVSPDHEEALNNLAWIFATAINPKFRNAEKAVRLSEHACKITGHNNPAQLDTLAAAYAEAGLFEKACLTAQKALKLAESAGQRKMAEDIKKRLALYVSGRPFYDH